jgi:4-carboxymuconolactone decarboxylase
MTGIDSVDFFTDNKLLADPYDYLAALRAECPLRREKHQDVVMLTGYDGRPARGHRQRRNLPVRGRMVVHHRSNHSRQRRSQDMSTPEQRLQPLPTEAWGEAEYAAFGALLGMPGDKVPRAGSGEPYDPMRFDIIGLLARHPKMARAFLTFNGFLLQRGELPARLRELTILRVALSRRSAYEWGQHARMAARSDISEDEIARLARGNDGFEGADRLVLDATDELLAAGHARWETWQALAESLGEHAAMEFIFVVGVYTLSAMAFETWGLPAAPGTAPLPD